MPMWELPLKVFSGPAQYREESSDEQSEEEAEEDTTMAAESNEQPKVKTQQEIDQDAEDERQYGKIPVSGDFVVHGTVYCKPEHADELATLYSKMTKIAKTEPGVIYYSLARNSTDPTIFYFFEHYESKAAFEAHTSREETQTILKGGWFERCDARFEKPL